MPFVHTSISGGVAGAPGLAAARGREGHVALRARRDLRLPETRRGAEGYLRERGARVLCRAGGRQAITICATAAWPFPSAKTDIVLLIADRVMTSPGARPSSRRLLGRHPRAQGPGDSTIFLPTRSRAPTSPFMPGKGEALMIEAKDNPAGNLGREVWAQQFTVYAGSAAAPSPDPVTHHPSPIAKPASPCPYPIPPSTPPKWLVSRQSIFPSPMAPACPR